MKMPKKTQKKKIKEKLTTYSYEDGAVSFSEDEIRKFVKKEVRKELRKALPYEIKIQRTATKQTFPNYSPGCGAWFLFMIMLGCETCPIYWFTFNL